MNKPESNLSLQQAATTKKGDSKYAKICGIAAIIAASTMVGCGDDMESSRLFAQNNAGDADTGLDCDIDGLTPDANLNMDSTGKFEASTFEASTDANPAVDSAKEAAADSNVLPESSSEDSAIDCGDLTNCYDQCVDLNDPANCGSCDNACPGNKPYCTPKGGCQECPGTLQKCPGTADCIDLKSNDQQCGGCGPGLACTNGEHCTDGICQ